MSWLDAHHVALSTQGPVMADPRLPDSRLGLLNLVITRGTPPRLEGCRPASRGFALALMTNTKTIYCADVMPTLMPTLGRPRNRRSRAHAGGHLSKHP
jgi:hypothetical protein